MSAERAIRADLFPAFIFLGGGVVNEVMLVFRVREGRVPFPPQFYGFQGKEARPGGARRKILPFTLILYLIPRYTHVSRCSTQSAPSAESCTKDDVLEVCVHERIDIPGNNNIQRHPINTSTIGGKTSTFSSPPKTGSFNNAVCRLSTLLSTRSNPSLPTSNTPL